MRYKQNFLLLLNIKPWEKVLIVTDDRTDRVAKKVFKALKGSARVEKVVMPVRHRDGEEPTRKVSKLMLEADVVIALTKFSLTHTKAVSKAVKNGVRVASMPRITSYVLERGAMNADYEKIKELTEKLHSLLRGSKRVKVKAKNGTNVEFSVRGRKWHKDDGFLKKRGCLGNLPAGEVFVAPLERSVNGLIVFDEFGLARTKLLLRVVSGKAVDVRNDVDKLSKIFRELGDKARQVAEFGIGTNPAANLIGNPLQDEKVYGTVHFGLGNNTSFGGKNEVTFHADGVVTKPTVRVDGKIIIRRGKWLF